MLESSSYFLFFTLHFEKHIQQNVFYIKNFPLKLYSFNQFKRICDVSFYSLLEFEHNSFCNIEIQYTNCCLIIFILVTKQIPMFTKNIIPS